MSEMPSGVLKGARIRPGEPYRLDPAAGTAQGAQAGPPATARIIEQADGVAVVEVVCGCGSRIHLR